MLRLLILAVFTLKAADDLQPKIDLILAGHRGEWGISVQKLADGQILHRRCAD